MGIADTFKALSDPIRRGILEILKKDRISAGELAEKLDMTPAALSYHLRILKNADLIMEYKEKNFIYYELNVSVFDELIMWTKGIVGGNDNDENED